MPSSQLLSSAESLQQGLISYLTTMLDVWLVQRGFDNASSLSEKREPES